MLYSCCRNFHNLNLIMIDLTFFSRISIFVFFTNSAYYVNFFRQKVNPTNCSIFFNLFQSIFVVTFNIMNSKRGSLTVLFVAIPFYQRLFIIFSCITNRLFNLIILLINFQFFYKFFYYFNFHLFK